MPFSDDISRYEALTNRADALDLYHLGGYQVLEASRLGGRFVYYEGREGGTSIVVPMIERAIPDADGRVHPSSARDLTMAYGYPSAFRIRGDESRDDDFVGAAREEGYVSAFLREHPVIESCAFVPGGVRSREVGATVSVSPTIDAERRRASYRKVHRRDIRRSGELGIVLRDGELDAAAVARFLPLYDGTMRRLDADARYFFEAGWVEGLGCLPRARVRIVEALVDDVIVAASLFSFVAPCAQYLLSASAPHELRGHGSKAIIDRAADLAAEAGCTALHLGGGLGGQRDSLYQFKAGFGRVEHVVRIGGVVLDEDAYARLSGSRGGEPSARFPAYRV